MPGANRARGGSQRAAVSRRQRSTDRVAGVRRHIAPQRAAAGAWRSRPWNVPYKQRAYRRCMSSLRFEWDPKKAEVNRRKHDQPLTATPIGYRLDARRSVRRPVSVCNDAPARASRR